MNMKKLGVFLLLLVTSIGSFSFIEQTDSSEIVSAFKTGKADQIANYFDDFIDLKLLDKDEVKNMSRNQAGIALKSFFDENKIKGFEKLSDREIGATMYMTGKLTNDAKGYNITVMLKVKNGKYQIITVRISGSN
jgi:hypothetical protein